MNISEETREYIPHVKSLEVNNDVLRVKTIEDFEFEVRATSQGYFILQSSVHLERTGFDDLGQLLTNYSPAYRDSFASELFKKLSSIS